MAHVAMFVARVAAVWLAAPVLAGRREAHRSSSSRGQRFGIASTVEVLDAAEVSGGLFEAGLPPGSGPKTPTRTNAIKKMKGSVTDAEHATKVSVLTITYNVGEAEWKLEHRKELLAVLQQEIETASPRPHFVVLACQEVFLENLFPLQEAVSKLNTFHWLGASNVGGKTKATGSQVQTSVEVAVNARYVTGVAQVMALNCPPKLYTAEAKLDVCKQDETKATVHRFTVTKTRGKFTKGFVSVWVKFHTFQFRFIGVHLDTEKFARNLKSVRNNIQRMSQKFGSTFNVIAGDYNTRLTPLGAQIICGGVQHSNEPFKERLLKTLDPAGEYLSHFDVARLEQIKELLCADSVRETMSIELAPPGRAKYQSEKDHAEKSMLLPTYKYDPKEKVEEAKLVGDPELYLGKGGAKICKTNEKKDKFKVGLGVLDHVAALFDKTSYGFEPFDKAAPRATVKHLSGSDHAMVSYRFTALLLGQPVPALDSAAGRATVMWNTTEGEGEGEESEDEEDEDESQTDSEKGASKK